MTRSTWLVRLVRAMLLVSIANAVNLSGAPMLDWAAGTAMVTTAASAAARTVRI
jgi:hypothetical protein